MSVDNSGDAMERRGFVKSPQDMMAGLFLIAFGLFCLWASYRLSLGRGANLGPGSFPRGLSYLLMIVGAIVAVQSLTAVGPKLEAWAIRGPVFVLGSVILFAITIRGASFGGVTLIPPLGLLVSGPLTLVVASLAVEERNWPQTIIFAAAMTAFCILLFKVALRLPIPIAPWMGW